MQFVHFPSLTRFSMLTFSICLVVALTAPSFPSQPPIAEPVTQADTGAIVRERNTDKPLLEARSLRCQFTQGVHTTWKVEASGEMQAMILVDEVNTFHFDSINLEKNHARFIGNAGSSDVSLLTVSGTLTFVEPTNGGIVFTTVFDSRDEKGDFAAVWSKHIDLFLAGPLPQQYTGSCQVWE